MVGSKHEKESFLDYKKRVLDPKGGSFCGAKWYNATVWLGSGMTTSCHHPLPHRVGEVSVQYNPKTLHNTPEKKMDRLLMQQGKRPEGCEYCWRVEDTGTDAISDRPYKSMIYTEEELDFAANLDPSTDVDLKTLEIAFDRNCNFACSYCNPAFSTTWAKDINTNGPYRNLTSDGRNHYTHSHNNSQLYREGDTNPYVEAFFKWWDTDLKNSLRELRITGGEPLMSPDLWRLLDWFKVNKSDVKLAINSNLGSKPALIQRLIDASHDIPHVELYTSCEATGAKAEYIRDGLVWQEWLNNIDLIATKGNFKALHVMATINGLCLTDIVNFLDTIMSMKETYGRNWPTITLNILRFPSFQSPIVMPAEIKKKTADDLRSWYNKNTESNLLHDMEREHILRLITYLEEIETPHNGASSMQELQKDFKVFYDHYSYRRSKNLIFTFPEIADWYRGL
jgi:organic radical activating enzyme